MQDKNIESFLKTGITYYPTLWDDQIGYFIHMLILLLALWVDGWLVVSYIWKIRNIHCYNNANQLIAEQLETSGISKAAQGKMYRYDRRGNLVEVCQGEELLKQFTFDTANRMSGSAVLSFFHNEFSQFM